MASDDIILTNIKLEGADQVQDDLRRIGETGSRAFEKLSQAANQRFDQVSTALTKVSQSLDRMSSTRVEINTDRANQALENISRVADQLSRRLESLGQPGSESLKDFGQTADQTQTRVRALESTTVSAFNNIGQSGVSAFTLIKNTVTDAISLLENYKKTAIGLATGGLIGGIVKGINEAVDSFKELNKAANASGIQFDNYQKLNFVLRDIGLTAKQSTEMLSRFGQQAKDLQKVSDDVVRVTRPEPTGKLIGPVSKDAPKGFIETKSVAREFKVNVSEKVGPTEAQKNLADAQKLEEQIAAGLTTRATDLQTTKERQLVIEKAITEEQQKQEKIAAGFSAEAGRQPLTDAQRFPEIKPGPGESIVSVNGKPFIVKDTGQAGDATRDNARRLADAAKTFQREPMTETLQAVVDEINKISGSAKQLEALKNVFGGAEEPAKALFEAMQGGADAIDELADRWKRIAQVKAEDVANTVALEKANKNLASALFEVGAASEQGKISLGTFFAPALATATDAVANGIRSLHFQLRDFAKDIGKDIGPAIEQLFKILRGEGADTAKTGMFTGLIQGLDAVTQAASGALEVFNDFFKTTLNLGDLGLGAALAGLVGGFNALALAVVGVFTSTSPGMAAFKDSLRGVGVDIDAIKEKVLNFARGVQEAFRDPGQRADMFARIKENLSGLPEIILGVVAAFATLRLGAGLLGRALGAVFGVKISAEATLLATALAQISGVLPTINTLASTFAGIMVGLNASIGILVGLLGWPLILAAGLVLVLTHLSAAQAAFESLASTINNLFGTKITGTELFVAAIAIMVAGTVTLVTRMGLAVVAIYEFGKAIVVVSGIAEAAAAGGFAALLATLGRLSVIVLGLVAAWQLWKDVTGTGGEAGNLERQMDALTSKFQEGKLSAEQYREELNRLQQAFAKTGKAPGAGDVAPDPNNTQGLLDRIKNQYEEFMKGIDDLSKKGAESRAKDLSSTTPPGTGIAPKEKEPGPGEDVVFRRGPGGKTQRFIVKKPPAADAEVGVGTVDVLDDQGQPIRNQPVPTTFPEERAPAPATGAQGALEALEGSINDLISRIGELDTSVATLRAGLDNLLEAADALARVFKELLDATEKLNDLRQALSSLVITTRDLDGAERSLIGTVNALDAAAQRLAATLGAIAAKILSLPAQPAGRFGVAPGAPTIITPGAGGGGQGPAQPGWAKRNFPGWDPGGEAPVRPLDQLFPGPTPTPPPPATTQPVLPGIGPDGQQIVPLPPRVNPEKTPAPPVAVPREFPQEPGGRPPLQYDIKPSDRDPFTGQPTPGGRVLTIPPNTPLNPSGKALTIPLNPVDEGPLPPPPPPPPSPAPTAPARPAAPATAIPSPGSEPIILPDGRALMPDGKIIEPRPTVREPAPGTQGALPGGAQLAGLKPQALETVSPLFPLDLFKNVPDSKLPDLLKKEFPEFKQPFKTPLQPLEPIIPIPNEVKPGLTGPQRETPIAPIPTQPPPGGGSFGFPTPKETPVSGTVDSLANSLNKLDSAATSANKAVTPLPPTLDKTTRAAENTQASQATMAQAMPQLFGQAPLPGGVSGGGTMAQAMPQLFSGVPRTRDVVGPGGLITQVPLSSPQQQASDPTSVVNSAMAAINNLTQSIGSIPDSIKIAVNNINSVFDFSPAANAAREFVENVNAEFAHLDAGSASGLAEGGLVAGPGTETSDSIPIWASANEFMMRASAVRHYGRDFMYRLNSMQVPRLSMGGLVNHLNTPLSSQIRIPRFAEGGAIKGGSPGSDASNVPVHVNFEGRRVFSGHAPRSSIEQLKRESLLQKVRSGGPSPFWVD